MLRSLALNLVPTVVFIVSAAVVVKKKSDAIC